jgi:hypothetical protein
MGWDSEFHEYLYKKYERASQQYNCCYLRIHKNPSELDYISVPHSFFNHFGVDIGGVEKPVWTENDLDSDNSLEDKSDYSNGENEADSDIEELRNRDEAGAGSENPQDGDSSSEDGDVENDDDGASVESRQIRQLDDLNRLRRERGENDPHAEYWHLPVVKP